MRLWRGQRRSPTTRCSARRSVGYVVWTVGGWLWALAPLTQLASYAVLIRSTPNERWRMHRFPVILAHFAGSAPWLLLYAQSREPSLLLPFATCYAANARSWG